MAGLPTEPPGGPAVSGTTGDLRSAVSAGSETRAEREVPSAGRDLRPETGHSATARHSD